MQQEDRLNSRQVEELLQQREQFSQKVQYQSSTGDQGVVFEKFVLYISDREHDVGSKKLAQLIHSVREDFRIIDVATLTESELPEWLDGTPILVDMREDEEVAYKGTEAFHVVTDAYPFLGTGIARS